MLLGVGLVVEEVSQALEEAQEQEGCQYPYPPRDDLIAVTRVAAPQVEVGGGGSLEDRRLK